MFGLLPVVMGTRADCKQKDDLLYLFEMLMIIDSPRGVHKLPLLALHVVSHNKMI